MRIVTSRQRQKISGFFEETQETARKAFERDGVCVPVAIFMCDEGNTVLSLHRIINHKDAAAMVLNKLVEQIRPLAFIFVTEAWMAKAANDAATVAEGGDLEKKYQGTLTEDAPDGRQEPKDGVGEAVMLQCCAVTGENFMVTAEIVRRQGGRPTLKPWEKMENRRAEGRFIFDVVPVVERQ